MSQSIPSISTSTRIVVLTGAGISAESGVATFRENGGLWEQYRIEDVATPEAFERDPGKVWDFYKARRKRSFEVKPNPAHHALAKLEEGLPDGNLHVITQNVDNLHRAAGSRKVVHMHGELAKVRCVKCSRVDETEEEFEGIPYCGCGGMLRPHIVWFGEVPMHLDDIDGLLHSCDVFLVVGTSGMVHPASSFLQVARYAGAVTIGVNLEKPANIHYMDYFIEGKAGERLPEVVDRWLEDL